MRLRIFSLLVLTCCCHILQAQDFIFSQFQEMPLLRNPAIAGLFKGDIRLQAAYRTQWLSVTTPYRTMAFSAESKIADKYDDDFVTLSLLVTNDIAGDSRLSRLQLLPSVNVQKAVSSTGYFSVGLMGGLAQSQFDPTQLKFDDQFQNGAYSPLNPTSQVFNKTSITYLDAGAGIAYSDRLGGASEFYIGTAAYHVNRPKVSFLDNSVILKPRFVVNAGIKTETSDNDNFYLFGDYITQNGHRQGLMGLMYSHIIGNYLEDDNVSFSAGAFYRWNDAFIPVIKLNIHSVSVGFSYDVNVSKLSKASQLRGGYELTASFRSFLNFRNSTLNKLQCPSF